MEDHIKGLARIKVNNIQCFSLHPGASHLITEGNQVVQAQFALDNSVLAVPNHLLTFPVGKFCP